MGGSSDQQSGLVEPGNIDLSNRPVIKNPDGTISTEKSFSIGTDKGETLIPQIVNGKLLSKQDAIDHYKKTGEHLGIYKDVPSANAAAEAIHSRPQPIIPDTGAAAYWYVDPRAGNYQGMPAGHSDLEQQALYRADPNRYSPPHENQDLMEAIQRLLLPKNTKPSL